MNIQMVRNRVFHSLQSLRRLFNLSDPRWGRSEQEERQDDGSDPAAVDKPVVPAKPSGNEGGRRNNPNSEPPDLDELWRDLVARVRGLFGGSGKSGGSGPDWGGAGLVAGAVASLVVLLWLGTGFFIVQEGQQGVITRFGKYHATVGAGFNWRLPFPFEQHELVYVTQIRSVDIGRDTVLKATGLRESAMLTEDENIVEIKFAVQYRLNDARAYLFASKDPEDAVIQAAETSVREVLGKMKMDAALSEERDQIATRVRALMQSVLERYGVGVEIVGINLQQGGVRPPEQVQAAFDDVLKAGQERERSKNEAQAYANNVVPGAVGTAARLKEEADAYKAKVVAQAQGDAQRFRSVLEQYQKAPQVTRDRMYLDAMQQVYTNATKVVVDAKQGSNFLYLPLDKLLQAPSKISDTSTGSAPTAASETGNTSTPAAVSGSLNDGRSRDAARSRDREVR